MAKYILVEFPEDSSYFEENGIGYPSYESQDNGARYVEESDYIAHFGKAPAPNQYYALLQWPESQELLDDPKHEEYTEAVMDEKGPDDFICPAFWVPKCYYEKTEK